MSAKDPQNAKQAKEGAENLGGGQNPVVQEKPVLPCRKKHWIGVRVVDDQGKPVPGVKVKLKLNDGTTPDITVGKTGSYTTPKNLDTGNCEVSFPELFDVEWKPQ
jgi:hypothetical protein